MEDARTDRTDRKRRRRTRDTPERSRAMWALELAALTLITTSILPIGGMHPVGQALWSLAMLGVFSLTVLNAAIHQRPWRWHPIAVAFFIIAAWMLVQAHPVTGLLAAGWTREIYALWPSLAPRIAVAPGRVPLAVLRWAAYGALVQTWVMRFHDAQDTERTVKAVLAAGGLTVFIGLAQSLLNSETIMGFYTPTSVGRVLVPLAGPFVNSNQAGALVALTIIVAVVAAWKKGTGSHRVLAGSLTLVGAVFLLDGLEAHGAFLGLVAGLAVFAVGALLSGPRELRRLGPLMLSGIVVLLTLFSGLLYTVLGAYLTPILGARSTGKLILWRDAVGVAQHAPWVGLGPGGFPDLYPTVESQRYFVRFEYVESGPLQLVVDYGLPIALMLLVIIIYHYRRWFRQRGVVDRDVALLGLAVGTMIAVEGITGMGLAATGYAFPVVALLGVMAARTRRKGSGKAVVNYGGMGVVVLIVILSLRHLVPSIRLGMGGLVDPLTDLVDAPAEVQDEAAIALARQTPGDLGLIAHEAALIIDREPDRAEEMIAYLQAHAPNSRQTWRLSFYAAHREGAQDEACRALREQARLGSVTVEVASLLRDPRADMRFWQQCLGDTDTVRADLYRQLHRRGRYAAELAAASAWLRDAPDDTVALEAALHATTALDMPEMAQPYALSLLRMSETSPELVSVGLASLRRTGELDLALQQVTRRLLDDPDSGLQRLDRIEILLSMVDRGDPPQGWEMTVEGDLERLSSELAGREHLRLRRLELARRYYARVENWGALTTTLESLSRLHPNDVGIILALAETAEAQRRRTIALRHYRQALTLDPGNERALRGIQALE